MSNVLEQARKIAIPEKQEQEKIGALAEKLLGLVKKEAVNYQEVVSIEIGGSFAKGTWLKGKLDLDIFVKIKKETDEKRFEEIGNKIGKVSMKKFGPYVRYSEHPYVEAVVEGTKVNVVPCYDVEIGQWKSAADRSSFHTRFILEQLDEQKKNEVRLLKKFLRGVDIYGAEIAKEGFGGYVSEVLIYHYGSFMKVLEAAANFVQGQVIGSPTKKFETVFVLIDPVDSNRNLGTAISAQNFGKFILAARAYLKKPSLVFFNGKNPVTDVKNLQNVLVVKFSYKHRSPDIIWGQAKRGATALSGQFELGGFHVLRKGTIVDEKSEAAMLFLLHSTTIEKTMVKNGPDVFRKLESESFILRNSKNKLTWVDDEGRILSVQQREFYDAKKFLQSLLKKNLSKAGIPSGIIPDMKRSFRVLGGHQVTSKSIKKALAELTSTNELIFGSSK
ncbi:MAG TPA: CCA tRNA nucleotidyltransferase [Candidatus Nitrosotalea sp.]|nr:CCA tRNA nucleotidyltransferase [Candidatus Nitrosotalea sp.]